MVRPESMELCVNLNTRTQFLTPLLHETPIMHLLRTATFFFSTFPIARRPWRKTYQLSTYRLLPISRASR